MQAVPCHLSHLIVFSCHQDGLIGNKGIDPDVWAVVKAMERTSPLQLGNAVAKTEALSQAAAADAPSPSLWALQVLHFPFVCV